MKPLLHWHISFAPATVLLIFSLDFLLLFKTSYIKTVFSPHFGVRIGCHAFSRCCLKAESAHLETQSKLTARVHLTCRQRLAARRQCN
jgi:hypothetical protein